MAVISTSAVFGNDVVRVCSWAADVAVARLFEYVRPATLERPRIVFDEFHHGFGVHGGSMLAVARYLGGTPSGRFFAQALIAGLLLVLANAPRPIAPRDPERQARRSPLEHADALGHAYADVGATRTATARLLAGVRRRVRRGLGDGGADDQVFLERAVERAPTLAEPVALVRRALSEPVPPREFATVGDALRDIEQQLTISPPNRS